MHFTILVRRFQISPCHELVAVQHLPHLPIKLGILHARLISAGVLADGFLGAVPSQAGERCVDAQDAFMGISDDELSCTSKAVAAMRSSCSACLRSVYRGSTRRARSTCCLLLSLEQNTNR